VRPLKSPRLLLLALLAAALIAAAVVVPLVFIGGTPERPTVAAWNAAAGVALAPLANRIPAMAQQEQQWQSGALTGGAYGADLGQTAIIVAAAQKSAATLPPYPSQPVVDRMYRVAIGLYAQATTADGVALQTGNGPLRAQIVLISDRLRELADRIFDQGRVLTAPGLIPPGLPPGTHIELPAEVPDWAAEGLAAGPPLAAVQAAPDKYPPLRQGARPTEPTSRWQATVSRLDPPATVVMSGAVQTLNQSSLAAMAATLQEDVTSLGASPDPAQPHGREASDRLRLSWLVDEEACRAGQAAALDPTGQSSLETLSKQLLGLADTISAV
jgi:hypothetical protein